MKALLEGLLPREFPTLDFLCVTHDGKQDLEKSIPRKLRAWREPGVRFVVLRDNDGGDCLALKRRLSDLCREGSREDTLVRIPCQELEAWYLGEPEALAEAYGRPELGTLGERAVYRDPDAVGRPSVALGRLVPEFQKISGARLMGRVISGARNRSRSFRVFLDGLRRVAGR